MRTELLSPCGNIECVYQAVNNGADAIYLAGKKFGARKYANNFTEEEIIKTINYCHLYGVKVYITVNTMIYEEEVKECLEYIEFLYKNNVDALIMQDIGLIDTVLKKYPNLEVHASTQCHNHNKEGISFLKSLGVKRIVLDRELSLDEINDIDIDIEKEVFIHGALCVSYSGCCLFSSMNGGRSGNRGECVGSCRQPYNLIENNKELNIKDKYLLSCKELNTTHHLKELLDNKITSLKIEGRMKSPEYVGYITRIYRKLIDAYYNNLPMTLTETEEDNLKLLYNREFTSGYLFHDDIINTTTSNHQGLTIGKVIETTKYRLKIKLDKELDMEDGIRFVNSNLGMIVNKIYNEKGLLINKGLPGDIVYVDNKIMLNNLDIVNKTTSSKLNEELKQYPSRKVPVDMIVEAKIGSPLKVEMIDCDKNIVSDTIGKVEESINNPVSKDRLKESLSKLGNSPFILNNIVINMDTNIFIPISTINEIRRILVDKLITIRCKNNKEIIINNLEDNYYSTPNNNKVSINALVRNEEQLLACINNNIDNIYTTDYNLYTKYKETCNIYYRLDRVMKKYINYKKESLLITELGGVQRYGYTNNVVSDYYLNIANNKAIDLLRRNNIQRITISCELDYDKIKALNTNYNIELIIYGRVELMLMKYCPLKKLLNHCSVCKDSSNKYYLESMQGKKYPIIVDNNHLTHIMHCNNINYIDDINKYINLGIKSYRIELFDETSEEINKITKMIRTKM